MTYLYHLVATWWEYCRCRIFLWDPLLFSKSFSLRNIRLRPKSAIFKHPLQLKQKIFSIYSYGCRNNIITFASYQMYKVPYKEICWFQVPMHNRILVHIGNSAKKHVCISFYSGIWQEHDTIIIIVFNPFYWWKKSLFIQNLRISCLIVMIFRLYFYRHGPPKLIICTYHRINLETL